jgi:hypothetical protein
MRSFQEIERLVRHRASLRNVCGDASHPNAAWLATDDPSELARRIDVLRLNQPAGAEVDQEIDAFRLTLPTVQAFRAPTARARTAGQFDKLIRYHGVRKGVSSDSPSSHDYWAPTTDPGETARRIDAIMVNRQPCTDLDRELLAYRREVAP